MCQEINLTKNVLCCKIYYSEFRYNNFSKIYLSYFRMTLILSLNRFGNLKLKSELVFVPKLHYTTNIYVPEDNLMKFPAVHTKQSTIPLLATPESK